MRPDMVRWLGLALVLLAAAALGWWAAQPPAAQGIDAPAEGFAAGRAMSDVRRIGAEPHATGTPANAAVRGYLVGRLQALGFEVRTTTTPLSERSRKRLAKWKLPDGPDLAATSIVAVRPGKDRAGPAVALMAHFDSVGDSPGAADDAAGVAAALEVARAIARQAQARDLYIMLTDGEELGLEGAEALFAPRPGGDPAADRIGALVNLEARGGGGRAFMFETGDGNGALVRLYRAVVDSPSTTSLAVKIYELMPNSTDFTPARKRGVAGINIAFVGDARLYHSPLATPDALDQRSLQHLGDQALAMTRALVTAPALPQREPDAVFGDVLGIVTLAYPPAFGWVPLGLAALCLLVAGWGRRGARPGQIAGAMLLGLLAAAVAAALLYAGNLLSGADGPMAYYDRLAALPRLETQALLLVAAAMVLSLVGWPRRWNAWSGWIGLVALNLLLALGLQVALPAGAPVLLWPLLPAALALAVAAHAETPGRLLAALAAIVGIGQISGIAHVTMLNIGGPAPYVAAAFVPLVLALLWPLLPTLPRRARLLRIGLLLVVAAAAIALWVRLDPPAPSAPTWDAPR